MSTLIFDLNNAATVRNKKGYEREIVSLYIDNKGVKKVKYRVKSHKIKSKINSIKIVNRKSFVDWLEGVRVIKDRFIPGDIIMYNEFIFKVITNKGIYGKVIDYEEGHCIKKFYWRGYEDSKCYKIGHEPVD